MKPFLLKLLKAAAWLAAAAFVLTGAGLAYAWWRVPNPGWSAPSLVRVMNDKSRGPRERWYAAVALRPKGKAALLEALPDLLVAEPAILQDMIPEYLLKLRSDAAPLLEKLVASSDSEKRQAAAFWLGAMARACDETEERNWAMEGRPEHGAMLGASGDCLGWETVLERLALSEKVLAAAAKDADPAVRREAEQALRSVRKRGRIRGNTAP